ncbi:unnamed protein product [Cylindrotheca closterium]|uniref:Uncharacterized protein n=1 Tax=Cylindrotheca closterium TaxID=2856 RepID=A0AAD2G790_9STRA|nr:unnamed protein product [Cylindrotheca closterium]
MNCQADNGALSEDGDGFTKNSSWIHLTQGKEFSRLLYPNPVCFLCTATATNRNKRSSSPNNLSSEDASPNIFRRNVMVISWLSPVDNDGFFVMSVNARRHSIKHLLRSTPGDAVSVEMTDSTDTSPSNNDVPIIFTLCVPTLDLKDLVLHVGSVSGKDICKFGNNNSNMLDSAFDNSCMSKRKKRKLQKQRLEARGRRRYLRTGCAFIWSARSYGDRRRYQGL